MPDSDTDVSELAREVVAELEDTRQIGDQLLLSRREAIALSTGAVSLGALGVAGAGTASAQEAAGQIGTEAEPVDVQGAEGNFEALEADEASINGPLGAESATVVRRNTERTSVTVYRASNFTCPADTETKIEWDGENTNQLDDWVEADDHLKASEDMTVAVSCHIGLDDSMTGRIRLLPAVNGSTVNPRAVGTDLDDGDSVTLPPQAVELQEGDELDMRLINDSSDDQAELDSNECGLTISKQ